VRPIVGAEVSEPGSKRLVTCLVKNARGYGNLCRLLTARHMDKSFSLEHRLPMLSKGLLLLVADLDLLQKLHQQGLEVVADIGPGISAQGREILRFCRATEIVAVATPDSSLVTEADRELYQLLQAVKKGISISEARRISANGVFSLVTTSQYEENFSIWPEVVPATSVLAERCTFTGPEFGVVMPPWAGGKRESSVVLREKAYRGAVKRYGVDLGEDVIERLEHELRVIKEMGFSSYFLVVRDIVHRKGEDGVRRKRRICGRGSGAASLVAYCLEITNVCPVKYNLYFERFLNPGRTDPPDIDIDFSWDERDAVLSDVLQDYSGHAAMVCNHVFFQPRMAIRETAKAFGLPGNEISRLTKSIPWLHRGGEEDLKKELESLPALRDQDLTPPWPEILKLSAKLIGLPRNLSVHPGGVVITPEPIDSYVPIEMAKKGVPIIQWEKDGAEEAGLVKIDLLGNRSLGVIRDCIQTVQQNGIEFDEMQWQPEEDIHTKLAVADGATMGCFYIESPAMRLLEKKAGTGEFEQLVIQSSIIRPAANEFCREYVRRLHGGAWQPLTPQIGDVLDDTFGLMVYQEDVSKVAVALASFSHADADGLRKVMSKKDKVLRLTNYKEMFFTGCAANDVDLEETQRMWAMMMSFDGYSFCKPHSASYARVSFQAAYLKYHYPAEFMAAVISNQGGYYSTFAYVSEAKRLEVQVLRPDVNRSGLRWSGRSKTIRVGLQQVHGLSSAFLERLFTERKKNLFKDLGDFFMRAKPADNEARALIHAGGLDAMQPEGNRTALLWQWSSYLRTFKSRPSLSLFAARLPEPPPLPSPGKKERLRREYQVLGFLCECHPLQVLQPPSEITTGKGLPRLIKVESLFERVGQRVQLVLWLLTGKLVSTRTGEAMEFLTFEDETGQVETTFFPRVYRAHAHQLKTGRAYLVDGLVEEDFGALTLTVERVVCIH
jgi:DNA-directed DNA polymerase III PolC